MNAESPIPERIDVRLAAMIDHTLLRPDATDADTERVCTEAVAFGFASVCVHPSMVPVAVRAIGTNRTPVCVVIGFPLGATTTETKVFEVRQTCELGAAEFDMVIHLGRLKGGDLSYVEEDIARVVEAARACRNGAVVKVILETSLLNDEEKAGTCLIARRAGADFVKTSTGFGGGGATLHDVALMRSVVGPALGVKASGGIRTREAALAMIEAGASRIGASAGIQIVTLSTIEQE